MRVFSFYLMPYPALTGDTRIPAVHAQAYAEDIPGAELVEIERAAHLGSIERPDALVEAIARFAL